MKSLQSIMNRYKMYIVDRGNNMYSVKLRESMLAKLDDIHGTRHAHVQNISMVRRGMYTIRELKYKDSRDFYNHILDYKSYDRTQNNLINALGKSNVRVQMTSCITMYSNTLNILYLNRNTVNKCMFKVLPENKDKFYDIVNSFNDMICGIDL